MIQVLISYKNKSTDRTAVKNAEVAAKYIDAIITIYKHDDLIDDVEKIEMIDSITRESKIVYPKVN